MDKIRFAILINFISARTGKEFTTQEIEDLHTLTMPPPLTPGLDRAIVSEQIVCKLMDAMKCQQKIEAIKAYRCLTNVGLREAKDAVEKYWGVDSRD